MAMSNARSRPRHDGSSRGPASDSRMSPGRTASAVLRVLTWFFIVAIIVEIIRQGDRG